VPTLKKIPQIITPPTPWNIFPSLFFLVSCSLSNCYLISKWILQLQVSQTTNFSVCSTKRFQTTETIKSRKSKLCLGYRRLCKPLELTLVFIFWQMTCYRFFFKDPSVFRYNCDLNIIQSLIKMLVDFLSFFFGSTRVWTQGFMLAKQASYYLSPPCLDFLKESNVASYTSSKITRYIHLWKFSLLMLHFTIPLRGIWTYIFTLRK
jgi:hypothetical protein